MTRRNLPTHPDGSRKKFVHDLERFETKDIQLNVKVNLVLELFFKTSLLEDASTRLSADMLNWMNGSDCLEAIVEPVFVDEIASIEGSFVLTDPDDSSLFH